MSSTTPNMTLVIPDVGTTVGPTWASELNTALELVDTHDHTDGHGVLIPTAGLNINGDLSFASHDIIDLNALVMDNLSADVATGTSLYVKNGELYYLDASANSVQITSIGSVAGATGTIGGMGGTDATVTYSNVNEDFTFNFDSSSPARLNIGDIRLYPYDGSTVFSDFVTIASPDALGAQYTWTMPLAVPSKTSPLIWTGAGVVDDIELDNGQFLIGSTAGAVAAGAITGTADQVVVTNGANSITLSTPQSINTTSSPTFATVLVGSGSEATPALRFSTDTDLGLWRQAANTLGVAATQLAAGGVGSASLPFYTFEADLDTGMYRSGADAVGIATGGTVRLNMSSTGMEWEGGGAFKVAIFTGSLLPANGVTITPGGNVLGTFGHAESGDAGGATWIPIQAHIVDPTALTDQLVFSTDSSEMTASAIRLFNNSASETLSYRLTVFHT